LLYDYETPSWQRKSKYPQYAALVVSFRDIFFLDEYLRKSGLQKAVDAIGYRNPDTLKKQLAFYILTSHSNCHAEDWWELTYARYLYPKAQLASQRIDTALTDIEK
jgi:hypothetical protein